MAAGTISGVLLDVGGTLWPESWQESEQDSKERSARVASILQIEPEQAGEMARLLECRGALVPGQTLQDSSGLIRETAGQLGLTLSKSEVLAVRRAMCLPAVGRWELFPGAVELLATIKGLPASCVLVSNATWRDDELYRCDLQELGVAGFVDAVITSVETGLRKPNPDIFELALRAITRSPHECVMVGNSEVNDIAPAVALGLRTIRVAIEEPRPSTSAAGAICGSLHEVAGVLRSWVWSAESVP